MSVIGITIFSLAVAIFSAFHSAHIPFIRHELDYPVRLFGSFGFGVAFSSLEKIAENAFKMNYNDVDTQQSGLPESSTPHLDALTMSLSGVPHATGGSDEDVDAEEVGKTPVADSPSMPDPTIIILVESSITEIIQAPPYSDLAVLMDFNQPKKTGSPKVEHFGKINHNINSIVLVTYISLFVVFIVYLFFLKSVTRATYRDSRAKVEHAAATAKEEMEMLTSETQSHQARLMGALEMADKEVNVVISEIPSYKSRLLAKVEEAEKKMDQEIGKESAIWTRMRRSQESIEKVCQNADAGEKLLREAITEMSRVHLRLPKVQVLLDKELDPFKEKVSEAKSEIERLVTGATQHVDAQLDEVPKDGLGNLLEKVAMEKARVAEDLRMLEEIKGSLPEAAILRSQVFTLEQDVKSSTREVERLEERAKESLSGLAGLNLRLDDIEVSLRTPGLALPVC